MEPIDANDIWTIGHSTRAVDELIDLLRDARIELVADVRRFPGSRRNPQYRTAELAASLAAAGLGYRHFVDLGGRRAARADSPNTAWRNESFRGYADYMATPAYRVAFDGLASLARTRRVALMCAEALWWRCHRSMLADEFTLRGWQVHHILGARELAAHAFRVPAWLIDGHVAYDGGQGRLV